MAKSRKISSLLGFKGGTCAYFFYNLPRFSVDLDFDLLVLRRSDSKEEVFKEIKKILKKYGEIKNCYIKRNTIFFLLSYSEEEHNIKVEISTRSEEVDEKKYFHLQQLLGTTMLVAKREYLFASKLIALTRRSETATRDVYDIWYFFSKNWSFDEDFVKEKAGKSTVEYIDECVSVVERIKDNQILKGMGELVDEQSKKWIKESLREEVLFSFKNYQLAKKKST